MKHLTALIGILLGLTLALPATGQLERREKATWRLAADRTAYPADSTALVAAEVTIEPGWHANSRRPTYDYLIPTELELEPPHGWSLGAVDYPPGVMLTFSFADDALSVYEGTFAILAEIEVPIGTGPGDYPLTARLTYQACDDDSCLPPVTSEKSLALVVGEGEPTGDPVFASLPADGVAGAAAPPLPPVRLGLVLLLGVLGGLLLNVMPCVLPVLSLKVFGLVQSAGRGRSEVVFGSLATAAGILLSFWALALAAVVARAAGAAVGWGVQFQEPLFVAALAVIVVLFSLNLWGIFEIPLPSRLARLAGSGPRQGVAGHLASGLFATLMATPCSAPFLGTAIGFALAQPAATIFAVFSAVAVGMALPYLALAVAPGAARWLPKPGLWMAQLRTFLGFLLAAAAVWLFYVLAAQLSSERLAFVQLALLALALFVWLGRQGSSTIRRLGTAGVVGSIVLTLVLAAGGRGEARAGGTVTAEGRIAWVSFDRQEAERLAADDGRMVFVDVTADWCFTCKVNERLVLETDVVAEAFERHGVVPMKADWTNRSDDIAGFLSDHGRYGVPFYLLYRPGREPHLFSELLTQEAVLDAVAEAATPAVARR